MEVSNVVFRGTPFHSATEVEMKVAPNPVILMLKISLPAVMLWGKMPTITGVGFCVMPPLLQWTSSVVTATSKMSEPQRERINPVLPFELLEFHS